MYNDDAVVDDFTEAECALAELLQGCYLMSENGQDRDGVRDYWYKLSARMLMAKGVQLANAKPGTPIQSDC